MPEAVIPAVECLNLHKSFDGQPIVSGVNIRVLPGQILVLLGPSGCGKTTILRLIAGFERLDKGSIEIGGQIVADGNGLHLPPEKRNTGMVFQDYAIFPHLNVIDNVLFGLRNGRQAVERAREMLVFVGMADLETRMPHELSGGQQQRIALARALAPNPAALLLDEPFSNLDAVLRRDVRAEVKALLKASRTTAVFVTHDHEEALFLGDEVAVMHKGQLEQVGSPAQIFHQPATRFVAEFVGQSDFLPATVNNGHLVSPLGPIDQSVPLPQGSPIDVMVRADDLTIRPEPKGNGRILSRQFVGIAYVYEIGLDSGQIVHSWQPHTCEIAQGTVVQVSFLGDHPQPLFHQGRAI